MDAPTPAPVALDELLEHRAWVTALALGITGNVQDAADLEQETWLSALANPPAERTSLRGWLRTVARRCAGRMRRTDERRVAREARAVPRADAPPAALLAERADVHRRIVAAVLALSEPSRETILLRYFEGLPVRDVARVSGVPVETARARLRRALVQLRTRLGRDGAGRTVDLRAALAPLLCAGYSVEGGYPVSALGSLGGGMMSWTMQSKVAISALGVVGLLACGTAMDERAGADSAGQDGVVQESAMSVDEQADLDALSALGYLRSRPHGAANRGNRPVVDPIRAEPETADSENAERFRVRVEQECRPTASTGAAGGHPWTGEAKCLDCHVTSKALARAPVTWEEIVGNTKMPGFELDENDKRAIESFFAGQDLELADALPPESAAAFLERYGRMTGVEVVLRPGVIDHVAGRRFDGLEAREGRRAFEVLASFCKEIGVETKLVGGTLVVIPAPSAESTDE